MKSRRITRWTVAATVALATIGGGAVTAAPANALANGTRVAPGQYPFYVQSPSGCGGALVAPTWVITARHCANDPAWTVGQEVRIGWTSDHPYASDIKRTVRRSVLPPNGTTWDVVLLEVDPVTGVTPLPLAEQASVGDLVRSIAAGDGSKGVLTTAEFTVSTLPEEPQNSENASLWARSTQAGVGIRFGDSGSPLISEANGKPALLGITRSTDRDRSGLWTGTSYAPVRNWITSVLTSRANFNGTVLTASTGSSGLDAIDGDPSTIWRSDAGIPVSKLHPSVTLKVDTGPGATATSLRYLPVWNSTSGMVTGYKVYGSRDGSAFELLTSGTWTADHWMKQTNDFAAGYAYLTFEVTSAAGDSANVSELIFHQ